MITEKKIVIYVIATMATIAAFFRWYIFDFDTKSNTILFFVSIIVLSTTYLFFIKTCLVFDKFMPYDKGIIKRLILQILINLAFIAVVSRVAFLIGRTMLPFHAIVEKEATNLAQIAGLASEILIVTLLNVIHFAKYSLQKWRENALRATNLEKEKSQVQFDNLKNQLNPHFLFNSLTSLDSLIHENPTLASEFLRQLAKVFRYVLQNKEKGLVSLETELNFIKNYVALLQTRFGESLSINFNISDEVLDLQIAPVTLQILVENALKHNIINKDSPLVINVLNQENYLIIENKIQLKKQVETSNGQGLNNLKTLYCFLSEKEVLIKKDDIFQVKVPLI